MGCQFAARKGMGVPWHGVSLKGDLKPTSGHRLRNLVVDASVGPHAPLSPVPLTAVELTDNVRAPACASTATSRCLGSIFHLDETERMDNSRYVPGELDQPFPGIYFKK